MQEAGDGSGAQAGAVFGIMQVAGEFSALRIILVQAAPIRANPEPAIRAGVERRDPGIAETLRVIRVRFIDGEVDAIVAVQAILGAQPEKTLAVLRQAVHHALRESLVEAELFKANYPGGIADQGRCDRFGSWRRAGGGWCQGQAARSQASAETQEQANQPQRGRPVRFG